MTTEIIDDGETIAIGKLRLENSEIYFVSYKSLILDMNNEWKLLNYLAVINAKNKFKKMKIKILLLVLLTIINQQTFSQSYPMFGPEINVTISGLTFDAMEPFISPDENTLFFNSLNSGGNTNLHYATKINDTTFIYSGLVAGTYDSSLNHLDAVASMDSTNNFFWVSLRSIPNLYKGNYSSGNVSNISQVYGDFNIYIPGWIIMDAAINYQGDQLYYCNAYFGPTFTECSGAPCAARLGVAQVINDSTFNKLINTDTIFSNINDTNYIVYAPQITPDGLELYYSRLLIGGYDTEICVSVRNSVSDVFSFPMIIHSNFGYFPEAASPTIDKQKIYYHQKDSSLAYRIFVRYRTGTTQVNDQVSKETLKVYPNPANNIVHIIPPLPHEIFEISIYSGMGLKLLTLTGSTTIDVSNFPQGIYYLSIKQDNKIWTAKIVKT